MQICMPFFDNFMQLGVLGRFFMRGVFANRVTCPFLSGSIFAADDEDSLFFTLWSSAKII